MANLQARVGAQLSTIAKATGHAEHLETVEELHIEEFGLSIDLAVPSLDLALEVCACRGTPGGRARA